MLGFLISEHLGVVRKSSSLFETLLSSLENDIHMSMGHCTCRLKSETKQWLFFFLKF